MNWDILFEGKNTEKKLTKKEHYEKLEKEMKAGKMPTDFNDAQKVYHIAEAAIEKMRKSKEHPHAKEIVKGAEKLLNEVKKGEADLRALISYLITAEGATGDFVVKGKLTSKPLFKIDAEISAALKEIDKAIKDSKSQIDTKHALEKLMEKDVIKKAVKRAIKILGIPQTFFGKVKKAIASMMKAIAAFFKKYFSKKFVIGFLVLAAGAAAIFIYYRNKQQAAANESISDDDASWDELFESTFEEEDDLFEADDTFGFDEEPIYESFGDKLSGLWHSVGVEMFIGGLIVAFMITVAFGNSPTIALVFGGLSLLMLAGVIVKRMDLVPPKTNESVTVAEALLDTYLDV